MPGSFGPLCAAMLLIIPTTNRDRDDAARPIRGEEPSIRDVRPTPEGIAKAEALFADRERIAVLPFAVKGDLDPSDGGGVVVMDVMLAGLRYAPRLLVPDRNEVLAAAGPGPGGAPGYQERAQALGARYLIVGELTGRGETLRIEARVIEVPGGGAKPRDVATAAAERPKGRLHELALAVIPDLLGPLKAAPSPARAEEMLRIASGRAEAQAAADRGLAALEGRPAGDTDAAKRALRDAEAALKDDPRYLRAAILQASCLARLNDPDRLKRALERSYNVRVGAKQVDPLTRLELDADYRAFARREFAQAAALYEKMLAIDPANLHALWMLTALHSGEFEPSRWAGFDLKRATGYAERLIAAHPRSAEATLLRGRDR